MVKSMFQKLFLTKAYLESLTDDQLAVACMNTKARLGYLNEKCDRAYARAMASMKELQATCRKVSSESALVVPSHVYMAECAARNYAEKRLCHWVDRAVDAEDINKGWEEIVSVEREFGRCERRQAKRIRAELAAENVQLLQQVDDLRNERNELLDCVHDLQQALVSVAPKGE